MASYPTLLDMGINNPHEIDRYHLHNSDHIDTLRIVYKRKKGSLLPGSKRFRFPQTVKNVVVDSGSRRTEQVYEISPFLKKALDELDLLINDSRSRADQMHLVMDEVERLERDVASRIDYIKKLISEMPDR